MTQLEMDAALAYSSIAEAARRLRAGEISAVALTRACLNRIHHFDEQINAFITLLQKSALAEAEQADRALAAGQDSGSLLGIPVAHKDLYYTRGIRTTAGSKVLADFVPDVDASVVTRLRQAGTVMLGKLGMHEFAMGGTNDNPHYGAVHNPWRLDRVPGGSSGGSGAALAAGFCLGATGTDTAGSIRIPAALCGVSGIKPTYGRVSCYGVVPLRWSRDHAGPMARTIEDCALLLNAMAGYDPLDPASDDRPVPDFAADLNSGVHGVRIGVARHFIQGQAQSNVLAAFDAALARFESLGAQILEIRVPALDEVARTFGILGEPTVYHEQWLKERPEQYSDQLRRSLENGLTALATDYVKGERYRAQLLLEMRSAYQQVDLLATPTVAFTAPPIGATEVSVAGEARPATEWFVRYTAPFNHTGFPAASVPCGFDAEGLPIGLQIAARPWQESEALRAAHAYQQATDWHLRHPAFK